MSSRFALAAAAAAALLGAHLASAQVAPTPVATATFATVDSLTRGYNSVKIAGLPQGDTQPVVVTVTASTGAATDGLAAGLLQNCEQLALLAMTKPGQFVLTVNTVPTNLLQTTCKLAPSAL